MNILKSHFWYNKSQRNGIFFLFFIIITLQITYVFVDFSSEENIDTNQIGILTFEKQLDSLKAIEIENRRPKTFPFNPNYITDFKGERLGLSIKEIDRLHRYRKQHKFVNSTNEFQQITKVSDSLLAKISPYFKFPDWAVKRNKQIEKRSSGLSFLRRQESHQNIPKNKISTISLNLASVQDLQTINGVGKKLSEIIVKYRTKLQGFSLKEQLYEVWYLEKEIADRILNTFKVVDIPNIEKLNVNTATFKEVLKNPYIDYELCKKIFQFRDEVAELQSISELKNIDSFPMDKYNRIILYLEAK